MISIKKLIVIVVFLSFILQFCTPKLEEEVIIYENDFSTNQIDEIENAVLETFESHSVLGFYNNEELSLHLERLPDHKAIRITLDVFFHDSWDGNTGSPDGPDMWYLNVDQQEVIKSTFSNSVCNPRYCLYQSYPENYPYNLNSKSGAFEANYPGRCQKKGEMGFTTRYIITKVIPHKSESVLLQMGDILVQDNVDNHSCDESWSLNGLTVAVLKR